jgi:outer membrane lipoprotein SlyB
LSSITHFALVLRPQYRGSKLVLTRKLNVATIRPALSARTARGRAAFSVLSTGLCRMENRLVCLLLVSTLAGWSSAGCRSPYYADRGAGIGALGGALAGAAIGENNGNALAGAVLGAAGGGLAGAAIGDAMDAEIARNQAIIEERMGRRMANAVSVADVVAMTQAGLSDDVIVTHIRAHGVAQSPQVDDLITLRNARVSDSVINAMQEPPPSVAPVEYRTAPVIVEEHYVYPPPRWYYRHHHHHHRRHRQPGVAWGFEFHDHW